MFSTRATGSSADASPPACAYSGRGKALASRPVSCQRRSLAPAPPSAQPCMRSPPLATQLPAQPAAQAAAASHLCAATARRHAPAPPTLPAEARATGQQRPLRCTAQVLSVLILLLISVRDVNCTSSAGTHRLDRRPQLLRALVHEIVKINACAGGGRVRGSSAGAPRRLGAAMARLHSYHGLAP